MKKLDCTKCNAAVAITNRRRETLLEKNVSGVKLRWELIQKTRTDTKEESLLDLHVMISKLITVHYTR